MFCNYCGEKIIEGAKFCSKCGKEHAFSPVEKHTAPPENAENIVEEKTQAAVNTISEKPNTATTQSAEKTQPTAEPKPEIMPQAVEKKEKTKINSLKNIEEQAKKAGLTGLSSSKIFKVNKEFEKAAKDFKEAIPLPEAANTNNFTFSALAQKGESAAAFSVGQAIPGPFKVIIAEIKKFFRAIKDIKKNNGNIVMPMVLAVIWFVLSILLALGVKFAPVQWISFLTFAKGGLSGNLLNRIFGILGKGLYAGALAAVLASFGKKNKTDIPKISLINKLKGGFAFSKDIMPQYLMGAGCAFAVYILMAGGDVKNAFMAGAAAAFLGAKAATSKGFMQKLAASFIAKGKSRIPPAATGFVKGLAAGFAAAALFGLSGLGGIMIVLAIILILAAVALMVLQKKGSLPQGKGAVTQ